MCRVKHSELRKLLKYSKLTGKFTWKASGEEAGYLSKRGYVQIKVKGKTYLAHILAYYYVTGDYPEKLVDHKDHNRANNKWSNLCIATNAMNSWNTSLRTDSSSGIKGVSWCERTRRWRARVSIFGKTYSCGYHRSKRAAQRAVRELRKSLHGEFACHG